MRAVSFFLFFFSCTLHLSGQITPEFAFVENRGQWSPDVLFKTQTAGGSLFLHRDGFTISLVHPSDLAALEELTHPGHLHDGSSRQKEMQPAANHSGQVDAMLIRYHAIRVRLIGADSKALISPQKQEPGVNNYFIGNDSTKWASGCRTFRALLYSNIYPGVDLRYYSSGGRLKYEFIVHPGASVEKIRMSYEGAEKIYKLDEQLHIALTVGEMVDPVPYTYQPEERNVAKVSCRYAVAGNVVGFKVKRYDKEKVLVIDPQLVFSTFTGSTGDTWGFTATYGKDGAFYSAGIAFQSGFPVSTGAYKEQHSGKADIAIMKFNADGKQRIWATYLGGSGFDQPHSMFEDKDQNLVVVGRTNSNDYPSISQAGTGGEYDILITRLNKTGSALMGSLKIGGSQNDGVNIKTNYGPDGKVNPGNQSLMQNYGDDARSEVVIDGNGNIYIAACTVSADFPMVGDGFQKSLKGKQDGVIMKIDGNVSGVVWSTYLGGSMDDAAYVLAVNPAKKNEILVGGSTASTDFPIPQSDPAISKSFQGGVCDGFVALLTDAGNAVKLDRAAYLGTAGIDEVYGVQFDKSGYPYVMGTTTGSWPVINAAFSNPNARQFISKLKTDISGYVYSTTFGTTGNTAPNISPVAFLVDNCENVYISGWGGAVNQGAGYPSAGTSGLPVTADAIKSTTDGSDFYFFVLTKDAAKQLYGSFYGQNGGNYGEHVDGGTSRFDQNGVIYQAICANCLGGATFPTYPSDVWEPQKKTYNVQACDIASVKIAFLLSGVRAGLKAFINGKPGNKGCIPLTVTFKDTIANGKQYQWNFGDGTTDTVTQAPEVLHIYGKAGLFKVRLIAIDPASCKEKDTSYIEIYARDDKANLSFDITQLMPCKDNRFRFKNTTAAPAGKPFTDTSFIWDFGDGIRQKAGITATDHIYSSPGFYTVKLILSDTGYCNSPDSVSKTVEVKLNLEAKFAPPAGPYCVPYTVKFNNQSSNANTFLWSFGDGGTSTEKNPVYTFKTKGSYTIKLLVINDQSCNVKDSVEQKITVDQSVKASFSWKPNPPVENTPVEFTNLTEIQPDVSYKWIFGDGDSLITSSHDPVSHQYNKTRTYNVCLITITKAGCTDTVCQSVSTIVRAAAYLPNAFAPGGINNIFRVKGYGIGKIFFCIYNRWGEQVFVSNNRDVGWDGTFKGQAQPMGVYVYSLAVTFTDDSKAFMKGTITLIR